MLWRNHPPSKLWSLCISDNQALGRKKARAVLYLSCKFTMRTENPLHYTPNLLPPSPLTPLPVHLHYSQSIPAPSPPTLYSQSINTTPMHSPTPLLLPTRVCQRDWSSSVPAAPYKSSSSGTPTQPQQWTGQWTLFTFPHLASLTAWLVPLSFLHSQSSFLCLFCLVLSIPNLYSHCGSRCLLYGFDGRIGVEVEEE